MIDSADYTGRRIRYGIDATNEADTMSVYSAPVLVVALPDLATADSTDITIDTTRRTADEQRS